MNGTLYKTVTEVIDCSPALKDYNIWDFIMVHPWQVLFLGIGVATFIMILHFVAQEIFWRS